MNSIKCLDWITKLMVAYFAIFCASCREETLESSSSDGENQSPGSEENTNTLLVKRISSRVILPEIHIQEKSLTESVVIINHEIDGLLVNAGLDADGFELLNSSNSSQEINLRLTNIPIHDLVYFISEQADISYEYTSDGMVFFDDVP